MQMDVNQLLFFEKHESTNLYCTVMNELGQVFYCEADEEKQPVFTIMFNFCYELVSIYN